MSREIPKYGYRLAELLVRVMHIVNWSDISALGWMGKTCLNLVVSKRALWLFYTSCKQLQFGMSNKHTKNSMICAFITLDHTHNILSYNIISCTSGVCKPFSKSGFGVPFTSVYAILTSMLCLYYLYTISPYNFRFFVTYSLTQAVIICLKHCKFHQQICCNKTVIEIRKGGHQYDCWLTELFSKTEVLMCLLNNVFRVLGLWKNIKTKYPCNKHWRIWSFQKTFGVFLTSNVNTFTLAWVTYAQTIFKCVFQICHRSAI
jgi:hypothetical protein